MTEIERVAPIVARALAKSHGLSDHRPCDAWMRDARTATTAAIAAMDPERLREQEIEVSDDWIIELVNLITDLADIDALDMVFTEVRAKLATIKGLNHVES